MEQFPKMEADKRFAHVATDPKFRRIPKGARKVKIDKRFQGMFKDKKFKVKYTVDKRGRPVSHSTTEDLKRYYDLDSDEEEESDAKTSENSVSEDAQEDNLSDEENESEDDSNTEKDLKPKKGKQKLVKTNNKKEKQIKGMAEAATDKKADNQIKKKLKNLTVDYARGEGNLLSGESSSDDEESDEEVELVEETGIDHKWGELDADAEATEEVTSRLAACNMDWDRIKASDLMVLFNSFLPPGGSITSVVIYTSEFGKKRLAEEEIKGPAELVDQRNDDENENQEGAKYHMEKLRQYQLNRLKYYYAVVTCNSETSANKIYTECDGMEYESSATKIDLRYIPEDMTFDEEPKEVCSSLPELAKYKPRFFTTTALQQAKVNLTWDETNPDRVEIAEKLASGKIDDVADADLQNYLASSSEEDFDTEESQDVQNCLPEENEDKPTGKKKKENMINKYKMLLQEIENKEKSKDEKDIGMEISWGIDLQKKTEQIIQEKKAVSEKQTPFEQFLDKRKEKRKEKRETKKNAKNDQDNNGKDDSDMPSDIDMNDSYFAEEFNKLEFKQKKEKSKVIDSHYDSDSETESAERKAQLELLLNDEDEGKKHFSLKKIQDAENDSKSKKKRRNKKGKDLIAEESKVQDDFSVNVNDERFSALYTSHHFNIDPTDPHFKKTKNMDKLINEKIKRRGENDDLEAVKSKKKKVDNINVKKNAELNVLVKSVKRKAEAFKKMKK